MRTAQFLVIYAPKTSNVLVVVGLLVLLPKYLQIRILQLQSLLRSSHDRQELIVISKFENSWAVNILCIEE